MDGLYPVLKTSCFYYYLKCVRSCTTEMSWTLCLSMNYMVYNLKRMSSTGIIDVSTTVLLNFGTCLLFRQGNAGRVLRFPVLQPANSSPYPSFPERRPESQRHALYELQTIHALPRKPSQVRRLFSVHCARNFLRFCEDGKYAVYEYISRKFSGNGGEISAWVLEGCVINASRRVSSLFRKLLRMCSVSCRI